MRIPFPGWRSVASKPSLADRLLRRFGLQRAKPATTRNQYSGAALNRLTLDWIRSPLSADKELEGDLLTLRARGRDLARNNPFARRFVKMSQNHIIGPHGVLMQPANVIGNRPHDRLNDEILAAWEDWGKAQHASASGRLSWVQLQRLAIAEWITAGEALFQIVYDTATPYGIALHPIDADRLDHRHNVPRGTAQNEIRYGVELSTVGKPVAYHILSNHPSEVGATARSTYRERIPADQIIHLALLDERIDLTRGVPQFAVAMRDLRHLDGAQEASLVALRTAASSMAFIITKDPNGESATPDTDMEWEGEPGLMKHLGTNQEVQSWDPHAPTDNYPDFTKAVLRALAAGLGVSYAALANDLNGANYSSMRVGRHEEQETWKALQQWVIDTLCQRVFDAWLRSALLMGRIRSAEYSLEKASAVIWQPRRWVSVDPLKDIEADEKRIALGLDSRFEIKGREGGDVWKTMLKLKEEQEYAEELGLNVEPPRKTGAPGEANEAEREDASDDAASGDGADDSARGVDRGRGARRVVGRRRDDRDRHQLRVTG